jgi:hypothetical protein
MKTLIQSKMGSLLLITVCVLWLGCTTVNQVEQAENKSVQQMQILQEQSSGKTVGKIPCPPYEIEISEFKINKSDGSGYWTAFCFGKTYKCTRGPSGQANKNNQNVNCERADYPET